MLDIKNKIKPKKVLSYKVEYEVLGVYRRSI